MKKFILPLLLILAVGMLAAVESEPSEIVGYFKKNVNDGGYQAFVLPFYYTNLAISNIMGDQFAESDVISDITTGESSTYYSGFGWFGALENMNYGTAYYINRAIGNGAIDYFLLGKVDPQGFTKTILGNGAFTAFGLNEAANVLLSEDIFGTNESDGDVISDINTGDSSTYYEGYGWFGSLEYLTPTSAYYYNSAFGSSDFIWTYTPTRGVNNITPSFNRMSK